jgi:hypothetical protein
MTYDECNERRKSMKRIAVALLIAVLAVSVAGCKGGSSAQDTLSILTEATAAMSDVSGYRMSGTIEMDAGTVDASGQSQPVNMEVTADVQNADGEMRQHMFATIGDYEVEAYIIGDVYYQNMPGQGWMKMSTGAYQAQNMNMGLVDTAQMEIMAQVAKDAEVIEENDEMIGLSFHLDQEYLQASLELYRKYIEEGNEQLPEEWLKMAEETISDFQADIRIWLSKADDLIQRMEMEYTMGGQSQMGEVKSSMQMDFFDYNGDITVELPPEAAQAQEFTFTR